MNIIQSLCDFVFSPHSNAITAWKRSSSQKISCSVASCFYQPQCGDKTSWISNLVSDALISKENVHNIKKTEYNALYSSYFMTHEIFCDELLFHAVIALECGENTKSQSDCIMFIQSYYVWRIHGHIIVCKGIIQFINFQCHYIIIRQQFLWRKCGPYSWRKYWKYALANNNMTMNSSYIIWLNEHYTVALWLCEASLKKWWVMCHLWMNGNR
jgi:hypothetical protein